MVARLFRIAADSGSAHDTALEMLCSCFASYRRTLENYSLNTLLTDIVTLRAPNLRSDTMYKH
jgi:hypothetical protein